MGLPPVIIGGREPKREFAKDIMVSQSTICLVRTTNNNVGNETRRLVTLNGMCVKGATEEHSTLVIMVQAL